MPCCQQGDIVLRLSRGDSPQTGHTWVLMLYHHVEPRHVQCRPHNLPPRVMLLTRAERPRAVGRGEHSLARILNGPTCGLRGTYASGSLSSLTWRPYQGHEFNAYHVQAVAQYPLYHPESNLQPFYLSTTGYSLYPSSFLTCVVPPSSFQQKSMMRPTSCS